MDSPISASAPAPVVLIGGVTGGIGSALARRLAAAGVSVAGYARDAGKLAALQAELPGLLTLTAEATQPAEVEAAVAAVTSVVVLGAAAERKGNPVIAGEPLLHRMRDQMEVMA